MLSESLKGIVVKTQRMFSGIRPKAGGAAFVPAATVPTPGGCLMAANLALPSRLALRTSDRNVGRSNPGEGTA